MPHYNVLFLCTGNSACSIMAEAILNHKGKGNFIAFSAGSHPTGSVRAEALRKIEAAGLSTAGLHSKSWEEFAKPDSPVLNFVFTVCDNAANEVCPVWPGQPITAHWAYQTPQLCQVRRRKLSGHSRKHSRRWIVASRSCSRCHLPAWTEWHSRETWTTSGSSSSGKDSHVQSNLCLRA